MIKNSKTKNAGILFELCVRQITTDILSGKDSKATSILKKYFVKTELGREYKLHEIISNKKNISESKAELIINTLIDTSKELNRVALKKQKYNLIKEISENYDINEFFRTKLPNYKLHASLYTLLEIYNSDEKINPTQVINNKMCLLEHLTSTKIEPQKMESQIISEFREYDKDTRILTHRILLEKFNEKYKDLNNLQKTLLKEFINLIDNPVKLKNYYNLKLNEIKNNLLDSNKKIDDKTTQIKINEVGKLLVELNKNEKINNNHLVNLLQYCELIEEIKQLK